MRQPFVVCPLAGRSLPCSLVLRSTRTRTCSPVASAMSSPSLPSIALCERNKRDSDNLQGKSAFSFPSFFSAIHAICPLGLPTTLTLSTTTANHTQPTTLPQVHLPPVEDQHSFKPSPPIDSNPPIHPSPPPEEKSHPAIAPQQPTQPRHNTPSPRSNSSSSAFIPWRASFSLAPPAESNKGRSSSVSARKGSAVPLHQDNGDDSEEDKVEPRRMVGDEDLLGVGEHFLSAISDIRELARRGRELSLSY